MQPMLVFQIGDIVEIRDRSASDGCCGKITDVSGDSMCEVEYKFGRFNCIKWVKVTELLLVG